MTLNGVGIVCALAAEARQLSAGRIADLAPEGMAGPRTARLLSLDDGTLLAISGMGAPAARCAAEALIGAGARALASWGMAGGLDPALAPGSICLPDEVMTRDGTSLATAPWWRERLRSALTASERVHTGRLLTVVQPISSPEDKSALYRQTGAVAVDMESAVIADVARSGSIPFVAVRVIVDGAHDVLPRTVAAAADGGGEIRIWQLIGALSRAPADIAPLIRLARRYRCASRSLAAVARSAPLARFAFPAGTETAQP